MRVAEFTHFSCRRNKLSRGGTTANTWVCCTSSFYRARNSLFTSQKQSFKKIKQQRHQQHQEHKRKIGGLRRARHWSRCASQPKNILPKNKIKKQQQQQQQHRDMIGGRRRAQPCSRYAWRVDKKKKKKAGASAEHQQHRQHRDTTLVDVEERSPVHGMRHA